MRTLSLFCFCLALLLSSPIMAQERPATADRPKTHWYAPDYLVVQHAGLIGMVATGAGFDFGRHDRTNAELLYGFTPGFGSKSAIHTFTGRLYYQSHPKPLYGNYHIRWLKAGLGISTTLGDQYENIYPDYFPKNYYIWPTATRLLPFVGSSIGREFKGQSRPLFGELYGELGTSEVMVIDKLRNKGIGVSDIVNLAIGLRLKL